MCNQYFLFLFFSVCNISNKNITDFLIILLIKSYLNLSFFILILFFSIVNSNIYIQLIIVRQIKLNKIRSTTILTQIKVTVSNIMSHTINVHLLSTKPSKRSNTRLLLYLKDTDVNINNVT